ncbi:uncharacterized protein LOC135492316 isoform X2 [Lineus longissimus]|uniref:uncharacterized protein LOC135492316 isoform X2 n=1 Tax=Lineus longissimus TaxID=88925 RepID=UPI002B4F1DB1
MEELQSWWEVPSIAHFCSLFREAFSLLDFDIEHLEDAFLNSDGENQLVLELMCRLLAGCYGRQEISPEQSEQYLKDIINARYEEVGRENPLKGEVKYSELPLRTKVEVLYALTEYRLDAEDVLEELKGLESDGMRLEPFGEDSNGAVYWYFYGTRLYREDPLPRPPSKPKTKKPTTRNRGRRGRKRRSVAKVRKKRRGRPAVKAKAQTSPPEPELENGKNRGQPLQQSGTPVKDQSDDSEDTDVSENVAKKDLQPSKEDAKTNPTTEEGEKAEGEESDMPVPEPENGPRRSSRIKTVAIKKMLEEEEESSSEESSEEESESSSEEEEEEYDIPLPVTPGDENKQRWFVQCTTIEDWEELAQKFVGSKIKCERELYLSITEDFMPELIKLFEDKEKEYQKKLLEFLPRRTSNRLEKKQAKMAADEKLLQTYEDEDQKFKRENDKEMEERRRLMWETQREEREKFQAMERQKLKEERARRVQLREERAQLIAEGKEIPPELMSTPVSGFVRKRRGSDESVRSRDLDEDVFMELFKVLDIVKKHDDAWLFAEPVKEEFAPGYFDVIDEPMDFTMIERKLNERDYGSQEEFMNDFRLMFKNCAKYNGSDSVCYDMAKRIERCMRNAMKKFLPKEEPEVPKEDKDDKEFKTRAKTAAKKFRPKRVASTKALEKMQEFTSVEEIQGVTSSAFFRKYVSREDSNLRDLKRLNTIDGKDEEEMIAEPMAVAPKNIACYNRQRTKIENNVKKSEPLTARILAQYTAQNGGSSMLNEVKPPLSMPNGVTQPLTAAQIALQSQQDTAATSAASSATQSASKNLMSRQYTVQTPYGSVMRFSKTKAAPCSRSRTSTKTSVSSVSAARIAVQQAQQTQQVHSIRMTGPQLSAFLAQNPGLQSRIIVQQTGSGMATVVQPTTGGIKPSIVATPAAESAPVAGSIVASVSNEENADTSQNQSSALNVQPVVTSVDMSLQRVIASIQSHALSQSRLATSPEEAHANIPAGGSREIPMSNVIDGAISASSSRSSTPQFLQEGLVPSVSELLEEGLLSAQPNSTIRVGSPPNPTQATIHHHPPVTNQSNVDLTDSTSPYLHGSMSAAKILTISRASGEGQTSGSTSGASIVTLPTTGQLQTIPTVTTNQSSGLDKVTRLNTRPATISYLPTSSSTTAVPVTIAPKSTFTPGDSDAFLGEFLNFAQSQQSKQRFGTLKRTAVTNIHAPTTAKVIRQSVPATVTAVSAAPRLPVVSAMSSTDIQAQSVNCLNTVVAGLDEGEANSDNMATVSSVDDQNISNYLADIGENSADSDSIRDDILGQALSLSEIEPMSPLDGNEFATLDGTDLGANTAPLLDSISTNTLGIGQQTSFNSVITTVAQPQTVLGGDLRLIQGTNGQIFASNISSGHVISTPGSAVATSLPHILTQGGIQQQYVISGQPVQGIQQIQQVMNPGAVQHVVNSGAVQMTQGIHLPQGTLLQSIATMNAQPSMQIVANTGQVQQPVQQPVQQVANINNDNPSIQALLQNAQSVSSAPGVNVQHVTISPDMYQHLFGQQLQQQVQRQFLTPGGIVSSKVMPNTPRTVTPIVPAGYQIVQNGATATLHNYGVQQRPTGP